MPNGQLARKTPIATTISRPANQSVTILVSASPNSTAPAPLSSRPTSAIARPSLSPITAPPAAIRINPAA